MTLPFNPPNKRKFQCFCCGVQYNTYKEYCEHIISEHEEGRDFVLCPLDRCKAPVRDIPSHFKANHAGQEIPKKGQLKASVWKDQTPIKGKLKARKPKFRTGYYESIKMQKSIKYRSGYEATVYECLDDLHEILGYEAEPFEISYIHKGEIRKYFPDILVHYVSGDKELWEIKPSNQTDLEMNKNKWFAANEACKLKGWKFKVITEKGIEKLKKKVKDQILSF